ncbi:DUF2986 domain-containing protein [Vibrio tapetis subsp. quintayensis]|uniref:DUF2986 domain-containing protein n=1 Tax=Vibrio tapetis TaxID=52443 RepID=UPI0025B414FD|nr:DUF2986 domain-containing protein [Vibrio tapetis]MDN3680672.1 DUF2986 domain-containing protein [Vibrio tapetis subsp. quintayensis]
MNRKKKINQILKKKQKKMNSKLHTSNKPKYVSKADRAKMELEEAASTSVETEQTENIESEAPSEQ